MYRQPLRSAKLQENRLTEHASTATTKYVESAPLVVCLWDEYEGQFVFSVRENSSDWASEDNPLTRLPNTYRREVHRHYSSPGAPAATHMQATSPLLSTQTLMTAQCAVTAATQKMNLIRCSKWRDKPVALGINTSHENVDMHNIYTPVCCRFWGFEDSLVRGLHPKLVLH